MKHRLILATAVLLFPLIALANIAVTSSSPAASSTSDIVTNVLGDITDTVSNILGTASTTDVTSTNDTLIADVAGAATSTESAESTTTSEATSSPGTKETLPIGSTISSGTETAQQIAEAEDSYYKEHGRYFQVLPNNKVPDYETGTVADALGADIPDDARIDIYQTPDGTWGYQVSYAENGTNYSVGEGPEAPDRLYVKTPPTLTASSTPAAAASITQPTSIDSSASSTTDSSNFDLAPTTTSPSSETTSTDPLGL